MRFYKELWNAVYGVGRCVAVEGVEKEIGFCLTKIYIRRRNHFEC